MSTSQSRSPSPRACDAAAFPILMRMPDLRSASALEESSEPAPQDAKHSALDTVPETGNGASEPERSALPLATRGTAADVSAPVNPQIADIAAEIELAPRPQPSPIAEAKTDLTHASSAAVTESANAEVVSPAAARRQRAMERHRRQDVQLPKRSWWTSHFPGIAIGFLLALVLTVYIARSQKNSEQAEQTNTEPEIPELVIDDGEPMIEPPSSLDPPAVASQWPEDDPRTPAAEVKPEGKSPALLTAKPAAPMMPPETDYSVDASPTSDVAKTPSAALELPPETGPVPENTVAAESGYTPESYPNTDPTAYRPGGRPPRTARVPQYPQTSTPNLR